MCVYVCMQNQKVGYTTEYQYYYDTNRRTRASVDEVVRPPILQYPCSPIDTVTSNGRPVIVFLHLLQYALET